jgi:hypothetical protein
MQQMCDEYKSQLKALEHQLNQKIQLTKQQMSQTIIESLGHTICQTLATQKVSPSVTIDL